jgi:hypothetical protein
VYACNAGVTIELTRTEFSDSEKKGFLTAVGVKPCGVDWRRYRELVPSSSARTQTEHMNNAKNDPESRSSDYTFREDRRKQTEYGLYSFAFGSRVTTPMM